MGVVSIVSCSVDTLMLSDCIIYVYTVEPLTVDTSEIRTPL